MQEKHLYEYAVIRVLPRVDREEFINVGVILSCPDRQFLGMLVGASPNVYRGLYPIMVGLNSIPKVAMLASPQDAPTLSGTLAAADPGSHFIYLRDVRSDAVWSPTFHPTRREAERYTATFLPDAPLAAVPSERPLEVDVDPQSFL